MKESLAGVVQLHLLLSFFCVKFHYRDKNTQRIGAEVYTYINSIAIIIHMYAADGDTNAILVFRLRNSRVACFYRFSNEKKTEKKKQIPPNGDPVTHRTSVMRLNSYANSRCFFPFFRVSVPPDSLHPSTASVLSRHRSLYVPFVFLSPFY